MVIKKDFSKCEMYVLIRLHIYMEERKSYFISELARLLGGSLHNPQLWNCVNYLKEIGVLKPGEKFGKMQRYFIQDKTELQKVIDEQDEYQDINKYVEQTHSIII